MTKSLMNAASALAAALAIAAPVAAQAAGLDAVSFRSTQASLDRVQTAGGLVLDPNPPSGQPPAIIGLARSTGTLRREHGQVSFQGSLADLQSDSAYTAWWFIFNRPNRCAETPCGVGDLFAGVGQAFNAGGFVTDANGYANFNVALPRGGIARGVERFSDISLQEFGVQINPRTETGLRQPLTADIRLIIRHHGTAVAPIIAEQTGSFFGGCDIADCFDDQILVFAPQPSN